MIPIRLVFLISQMMILIVNHQIGLSLGDEQRCRLDEFDPVSLRAHLSPTVLEATAIERFRYFNKQATSSSKQSSSSSSSTSRSYSVLFQIKRIFKYENRLYENSRPVESASNNNETYFYISSQSGGELSDEINLNSFFLVENFTPQSHTNNILTNTNNLTCRSANIQMNKNYYLFIDGQDTSIKLSDRRIFTYPIRVNSLSKLNKRLREKRAAVEDGNNKFAPSKLALFVKMPIFNLSAKPLLADNHFLEQTLEKILCQNCVKEPRLKLKSTHHIAIVNQTAKIECNYNGNPTPHVYWKRQTIDNVNEILTDDFKFTIYNTNEAMTSVLLINEVKPEDEGYYYCMARDFVNGDERNEVIVQDRIRLIVRRHPINPQQQQQQRHRPRPNKNNNNNNNHKRNHNHNNNNSSKTTGETLNKDNRRKNTNGHRKVLKQPSLTRQRQKQLIEESLSRSQQTSTHVSTLIRYLTTSTAPNVVAGAGSASDAAIKERKRTDLSPTRPTDLRSSDKTYIRCSPAEDTCINGGACYITNPNLYKDEFLYNQSKIKFCVCEKYYEGQNCEISLLKSIVYNRDEIPSDLHELWESLGKPYI